MYKFLLLINIITTSTQILLRTHLFHLQDINQRGTGSMQRVYLKKKKSHFKWFCSLSHFLALIYKVNNHISERLPQ